MNTVNASYLQYVGSLDCVINTTMHNGGEATWEQNASSPELMNMWLVKKPVAGAIYI